MSWIWALLAVLSTCTSVIASIVPFDEWEHQRVLLKDVNIHFRYAGKGPPLLLVHGFPQYSVRSPRRIPKQRLRVDRRQLTFHTIGPILAQKYTVIAVDLRGAAQSTIPVNNDYTSETVAEDLKGVLDFLNITQTYVFAHDKGCGPVAALSAKHSSLIKRVGFSEYLLPGFGYEAASAPAPNWDTYQNWQLAFFSVPDAAQFFMQGKEREMLTWYFFHASYSGNSVISTDHLDRYTREIAKPGFLRSGFTYFASFTVAQDAAFFNTTLKPHPLTQPVLVLGGESSLNLAFSKKVWGTTAKDITYDTIPKAGHWIGTKPARVTRHF